MPDSLRDHKVSVCRPKAGAAAIMCRSLGWMVVKPSSAAQVRWRADEGRTDYLRLVVLAGSCRLVTSITSRISKSSFCP